MTEKKGYSQYILGDMLLQYNLDERNRMSMTLIPAAMKDRVTDKTYTPEPLVQIHAKGDQLPNGYGNGHTMACTTATDAMKFAGQKQEGNTIITTLADETGRTVHHRVRWEEGKSRLR